MKKEALSKLAVASASSHARALAGRDIVKENPFFDALESYRDEMADYVSKRSPVPTETFMRKLHELIGEPFPGMDDVDEYHKIAVGTFTFTVTSLERHVSDDSTKAADEKSKNKK